MALDRFLQDDHPGARRAAAMALELDPQNRKARELLKILGALALRPFADGKGAPGV